ncbi:hypothetical protein [Delftia tsuruhatensis]|uniref:hypothetical protein n=1 Tax=Delftia tsuruhatensis TaxID=180282 RepID=UPI000ACD8DAB|nr:hypothetical protein [Delftia tsuruhatensis]
MIKEKLKIKLDDLLSRQKEKKAFKRRFKDRMINSVKNAFLIPIILAPLKILGSLIKSAFPEQKIESYKDSMKRNGLSNEDMKQRQKTHIFLRNFFLIVTLLDLVFALFFNDKISYVIYSISIFTLLMIAMHHDLRVWQIENKRLCFLSEYLVRRFITRK